MNDAIQGKYVLPKDWEELTDSEKIERQRDIIKDLQRTQGYLSSRIQILEQNFPQHSHTDKGIVIPLSSRGVLGGVLSGENKLANPKFF